MSHTDRVVPPNPRAGAPDNWMVIRQLLCERIRRRWHALRRLSGETAASASIETQLSQVADDAASLWQLAERIDRELDAAFAPRAQRLALPAATGTRQGDTDPDAFKAR